MNQLVDFWVYEITSLNAQINDVPTKIRQAVLQSLYNIGFVTDNDIDFYRDAVIARMSDICNQVITSGFDVVLSDGENHHFSLTTQDQLNLITLSTMLASGMESVPYHADGELCSQYSAEDMLNVINTATSFKTYHVTYYNALKAYIQSLGSIADLNLIEYGVELPEEYQTDILKELIANK